MLELPGAKPLPLNFKKGSFELMYHVRSSREKNVKDAKLAKLTVNNDMTSTALNTIQVALLVAAQLMGKVATSHIGRQRPLTPKDLNILTRAIHQPMRARAKLGIKQKRLICFGSKFFLDRQAKGLRSLVESSRKVAANPEIPDARVHGVLAHMWDEVNFKFRQANKKFRQYQTAR